MGSLHPAALGPDPLQGVQGEVFTQNKVCDSFGAIKHRLGRCVGV